MKCVYIITYISTSAKLRNLTAFSICNFQGVYVSEHFETAISFQYDTNLSERSGISQKYSHKLLFLPNLFSKVDSVYGNYTGDEVAVDLARNAQNLRSLIPYRRAYVLVRYRNNFIPPSLHNRYLCFLGQFHVHRLYLSEKETGGCCTQNSIKCITSLKK